jgi:hypothetical protein
MHKDVMASAEALDTIPLPHILQDYFQLAASYIKTGKEILILLHVPGSASDNLLTIYKYIPYPFPIMPSLSIFNFSGHSLAVSLYSVSWSFSIQCGHF